MILHCTSPGNAIYAKYESAETRRGSRAQRSGRVQIGPTVLAGDK